MEPLLVALRVSNLNLLHEGKKLSELLDLVRLGIPSEMVPYFDYCSTVCKALQQEVGKNLDRIALNRADLLPELLSDTQRLSRTFQGLNQVRLPPLFRASSRDRLCLWVLVWLHQSHPRTANSVLAMSDGSFSVRPLIPAPIYYIPSSSQHGLLYLPLLFHEFGHLLFTHHKQEMHDLVLELQKQIRNQVEPAISRSDDYDQSKAEARRQVVETWYDWMEEIFCDAVGYCIGGVAFAEAFSNFLLMKGDDGFYQPSERLAGNSHPVSWIRIKLLVSGLERDGHIQTADQIKNMWAAVAEAKGIDENFHGYFEADFAPLIELTLKDMLIEVNPIQFELSLEDGVHNTPPQVLDFAWAKFREMPESYQEWEKDYLDQLPVLHNLNEQN